MNRLDLTPSSPYLATATVWLVAAAMLVPEAAAQPAATARRIYESACAACHGSDGRGAAAAASDYPLVPPDFTDCRFASREPDADWLAVSHAGGPARGFSTLMPAFGEALARDDLEAALVHVRTFCTDGAWPRGELNLPRALVTTKAYPEDEAVLTVTTAEGAVTNTFVYERRFGARNQAELVVPLAFAEREVGDWTGGIGDVALAFKRVIAASLRRGSIFSAAVELITPTGSTERGIGDGATVLEPFAAFGQILPRDAFLQFQAGVGLPLGGDRPNETFWRAVAGQSFTQGAFGRAWSPMIEVLGAHEHEEGAATEWDLVPQLQVTLNTRQHIMFNAGIRLPVNQRESRPVRFMVYVLWDWFDGGLFDGW
jgi:mono/diheme cytochrome c family protein